ncbi:hypothetical protein ACOSQ3_023749 [Xanthoceras sorbifolium]
MEEMFKSSMIGGFRIPRASVFFSPMLLNSQLCVNDLQVASGAWNVTLIQQSFISADAEAIFNLPPPIAGRPNGLCWFFDKYGFYSVRSGYRVASFNSPGPGPSSYFGLHEWWKSFWKIKLFVWRAVHGWLQTIEVLVRRHLAAAILCPICHWDFESILHAL